MRHLTTVLLTSIAALALLAGCDSDGSEVPNSTPATSEPTSEPTSETTASSAPPSSAPAAVVPPFSETTRRQMGKNSRGSLLVLTDVRVGEHDGFSRIVLEFSGPGRPGWVANYVDEAVLDGSGTVVDVGDGAILDVYARGTTAPAPGYYDGPRRISPRGSDLEVFVAGTFEGDTQVLAGLDGDRAPFRVFALTSPTRLVVDVAR